MISLLCSLSLSTPGNVRTERTRRTAWVFVFGSLVLLVLSVLRFWGMGRG